MKYRTRDFGEIEIETSQILHMRQPIFGFDDFRRYAMLYDPEAGEEIAWLQSLDDPELCFIVMHSRILSEAYQPQTPVGLDKLIGAGEYESWLIAVIREEFAKSTINLKSPVYINWKTGSGAQVILEGDYPVRYPLIGEADGAC